MVESFKSTLDEVREADILLHVVDISHPGFEDQIDIVNDTLKDIGAREKTTYLVFNKVDAYEYVQKDDDDLTPKEKENYSLDELKHSWMASNNHPCIFISAREKINFDEFKQILYEEVKKVHITRYPYDDFLY